jgi:hypothetical protein
VLVARRLWENWANVRFLCPTATSLALVDPIGGAPDSWRSGTDVTMFLWPYEDNTSALAALPAGGTISVREGAREQGDLELESRLLYIVLRGSATTENVGAPLACWADGICLLSAQVQPGIDSVRVSAMWLARERPSRPWTIFRHLECGGNSVGQMDGQPALGYYPADRWRPDDVVEDAVDITALASWRAGCRAAVGWYDGRTGERLPLTPGATLDHDDTAVYVAASDF